MSGSRLTADTARRAEIDEWVSILSHDLRTPLNSIKTWAHFLDVQLRDADPALRRAIDGVMIGVEQQARLIDGLPERARALDIPRRG